MPYLSVAVYCRDNCTDKSQQSSTRAVGMKSSLKKALMWDVDVWKSVFDWSSIVLISLTVFTGAGALITGKIISDRQDETIAELNKQSKEAIKRTAELEAEAASARLETEKLKQAVSWRAIPVSTASELEKLLSRRPGKVNLRYTDGDPEALFLAIQLSQILGKAKWQVAPGALKFPNSLQFGIVLPDSGGPDANALRSAFSAAKLGYSTNPLPSTQMGFSIATIDGAPTLMVGSKLPPSMQ